ncbi:MAG: MerR family transcriptional regulator [Clostridia bacterium]|nr:MerR family transcriptional regulator [Clostridia bacterium]
MSHNLTIGELAKRIGINPKTIRYYESIGLITSHRAQNGYRVYTSQDESHLLMIKRAKLLGLTLKEIGVILQDVQSGLCKTAKSQIKEFIKLKTLEIDKQISELSALKNYLTEQLKQIETDEVTSSEVKDCLCLGEIERS